MSSGLLLMRRRMMASEEVFPLPIFYASLQGTIFPEIIDSQYDFTYSKNANATSASDRLNFGSTNAYVKWNPQCPANTDLTFSCWVNTGSNTSNVNYSFGTATTNNDRYKGLQTTYYQNVRVGQEYCLLWWDNVTNTTWNIQSNTWIFLTWSIKYNGNNSYTLKGYENGVYVSERTITNTSWLGMANTMFAIGHGTNNDLKGNYKHFSVFPILTDSQVLQLYQNGGVPLTPTKTLIVNLPLSSSSDKKDTVSNSSTWDNSSRMSWNSTKNAWKFTAAQNASPRLKNLSLPSSFTKRSTTVCTIEADIMVDAYTGNNKRTSLFGGLSGSNEDNFVFFYDPSQTTDHGKLTANTWYHIKIIREGTTVTYYADGNKVGYVTGMGESTGLSQSVFCPLGARWGADVASAFLKNIQVYTIQ